MISKFGGSQDLNFVSRLRELIVQNYFKPLLSSSPLVGLPALATRPQQDPLANNSRICSCLMIIVRVILMMQHSLEVVPSDAFNRAFQPDALRMAILIWCLGSTAETTLGGRMAIYGLTSHGVDEDVLMNILTSSMEHISAEMIAERCKEALREAIEDGLKNPGPSMSCLFVVGRMCCPAPTSYTSTLDQVLIP
ncbi:hypothetical protein M408DRAFT_26503 [Serendipita vermifera MAFF 305830]|uniref:Uncharacterized protein n=1 Tax=Serendipita vermifera MAFF 305830 TaxID=933852 RepID=A0A0C3B0T0_SERVB|nr:hypothetical protein M408DRAFT_26503 [Serendipita vermifera MAFF 305830]